MSKENLHDELQNFTSKPNFKKQSKVDINILLNKVRAEEKKENIEKSLLIGFITTFILIVGLILSV